MGKGEKGGFVIRPRACGIANPDFSQGFPNRNYLNALEASIPQSPRIKTRTTTIRPFSGAQGRVEITLAFSDGSELYIAQVVNLEDPDPVGKYGYHYQDAKGALIFRYDNKTHHRTLPTFPNHKHLPESVAAAQRPTLADVVAEALAHTIAGTQTSETES